MTHILFNLYGTLIDGAALLPLYTSSLGHVMAARYGSAPERWAAAYRQIVADWDDYYADLNLSGDDGLEDMWEGMFRTTRALFRLTGAPEPDKPTLTALARRLPGEVSRRCDAAYPDAKAALRTLHQAGYTLGVYSLISADHIAGVLAGAGLLDLFTPPLWGTDTAERFERDREFFTLVARSERCFVVDTRDAPLEAARQAGLHTIQLCRPDALLTDLLDWLTSQAPTAR